MPEDKEQPKLSPVTGGPPEGAPPPTEINKEIPQPDISQPHKTVHRANKLLKQRLRAKGKGKKGKAKKGKKSDVPKLFADGLNDQEVADVTGFSLDEVRELRQNPWGHKGPKEVKPHRPKHEPKSKLPKDYKHPVAHPKKAQTLKPSAFGKERAEQMEAARPSDEPPTREINKERRKAGTRARKTATRRARPRLTKAKRK